MVMKFFRRLHIRYWFVRAAEALLPDERIKVRFRPPLISDFLGQVHRDTGWLVVDLDPGLGDADLFFVFLHELGHIEAGHCVSLPERRALLDREPVEVKIAVSLGRRIPYDGSLDGYEEMPEEVEANSFANGILNYARQKAYSVHGDDSVLSMLRVLSNVSMKRES